VKIGDKVDVSVPGFRKFSGYVTLLPDEAGFFYIVERIYRNTYCVHLDHVIKEDRPMQKKWMASEFGTGNYPTIFDTEKEATDWAKRTFGSWQISEVDYEPSPRYAWGVFAGQDEEHLYTTFYEQYSNKQKALNAIELLKFNCYKLERVQVN
jgi:uncharacterized protein YegP (UPF0339 family)